MIPVEKSAAVSRGLEAAFGTSSLESITRLTRGLSSDLVFHIVVQSKPFLLRIMTRINEQNDPERIFPVMRAAAQAGLAPAVHYTDPAEGIVILDWIASVPFPTAQALPLLADTLRQLHSLPPFPKAFNYATTHRFFLGKFPSANLRPAAEIDFAYSHLRRIAATYPRLEADIVSSHMDLKPENILFDGHRVWLIDWQAAFQNDRYFDLALIANFLIADETGERLLMRHYFGQPPTEYQLARFFLMRQIVHWMYAAVFLLLGAAGQPIDPPGQLPAFANFHKRIWDGEIDLAQNSWKIIYGGIHWVRLLDNLGHPRLEQSVERVSIENPPREHLTLLLPETI